MKRVLSVALASAALILSAGPAFAHVTVNPSSAAKGSYAKLTFRVPNESDTASTIKVEIEVPANAKFKSARVKPLPGWTYAIDKTGEFVSKITFSGGKIGPGEFQEFDTSFGPLPEDLDQVDFKALQTYDDGEVARWIEETPEGGEEPEHPAPVLTLTEATGDGHHDAATADEDKDSDSDSSSAPAIGLSVLAIALSGLAIVLSIRAKKPSSTS